VLKDSMIKRGIYSEVKLAIDSDENIYIWTENVDYNKIELAIEKEFAAKMSHINGDKNIRCQGYCDIELIKKLKNRIFSTITSAFIISSGENILCQVS